MSVEQLRVDELCAYIMPVYDQSVYGLFWKSLLYKMYVNKVSIDEMFRRQNIYK